MITNCDNGNITWIKLEVTGSWQTHKTNRVSMDQGKWKTVHQSKHIQCSLSINRKWNQHGQLNED